MRKHPTSLPAALLGLVLCLPGIAQAATVEATLNVRAENPPSAISQDVGSAMRRATVVRLQEVWGSRDVAVVERAVRAHPRWQVSARVIHTGDPILWKTTVWQSAGLAHALRIHRGISGLTPDRFLTWKALRLRATGQVLTIANVHAVSGYCSGRPEQALRQRLAHDYWSAIVRWTRQQEAAHPEWAILLGGDFNCWLGPAHPFPRRVLLPGYRLDRARWYDHLLTSRTPGAPATLRRWAVAAHSDHDLGLRKLAFGS